MKLYCKDATNVISQLLSLGTYSLNAPHKSTLQVIKKAMQHLHSRVPWAETHLGLKKAWHQYKASIALVPCHSLRLSISDKALKTVMNNDTAVRTVT